MEHVGYDFVVLRSCLRKHLRDRKGAVVKKHAGLEHTGILSANRICVMVGKHTWSLTQYGT